jgi:hypothetical protein
MTTMQRGGWFVRLAMGALCVGAAGPAAAQGFGDEAASLSALATGRVAFEDPTDPSANGRVAIREVSLAAPLAAATVGDVDLAAGAWLAWTRLEFRGHPELGTEDLHGVSLFAAAERPAGEKGWGGAAMVMPGYYSDLRGGHTGEPRLVVHAEARYAFSPRLQLCLGGAYDTSFGRPQAYPVGGVIWTPAPAWSLRAVLPAPSVAWTPAEDVNLFAFVQPAGDRWVVSDDDTGRQVFRIESWRAGLGVEHRLWKSVRVRVSGGMDFARSYEARQEDRVLLDDDVNDTWFAALALVLYE